MTGTDYLEPRSLVDEASRTRNLGTRLGYRMYFPRKSFVQSFEYFWVIILLPKSIKVELAIRHWAFGHTVRVLSSIYRLGEKSRVGEGHELPRGERGHAPPEIFWNEYALRRNLVHFETQFWEMLQWYFILFFSRDHVLTMLHLAPIFFWGGGGGGGKLGILGGSFYPSNTLDRTLTVLTVMLCLSDHQTKASQSVIPNA